MAQEVQASPPAEDLMAEKNPFHHEITIQTSRDSTDDNNGESRTELLT